MLDRVLINFELIKTQSYDRSMIPSLPEKLYKTSYFEDCRSSKNRSILCVCEDSENEQDAKRAVLGNFYDKDLTISHISSY